MQTARLERLGDRRAVDRAVFNWLLEANKQPFDYFTQSDIRAAIPLLQRWVAQAPIDTPQEKLRLLTARRSLLACVHGIGMDVDTFLAAAIGEMKELRTARPWQRQKRALLASIDAAWQPDLHEWAAISAQEASLYAIAALFDEPHGKNGLQAFDRILDALPGLPPASHSFLFMRDLAYASYITGFGASARKYDAKRALNALVQPMLGELHVPAGRTAQTAGQPRRLLIISELYDGANVMHRCYGEVIAGLREQFHITWLADAATRCAEHAQLAHEVFYFDSRVENLPDLARLAVAQKPDILYYPSVGMAWWTFALANLRIAPMQVASLGHPCPSGASEIDWLAMPHELHHANAWQGEKALTYARHPILAAPYQDPRFRQLAQQRLARPAAGGPLTIGINASSMKLNHAFLSAVRSVMDAAPAGTQLRFFPNTSGLRHFSILARLGKLFPEAEIMPSAGLETYFAKLAGCDLVLQSFPFGGTNTTTDSLALGIPVVCLSGVEAHSRIDMKILRQLGLDDQLLAHDLQDYLRIAGQLLADAKLRARCGGQAAERIVDVMTQEKEAPSGLAQAMLQAWEQGAKNNIGTP